MTGAPDVEQDGCTRGSKVPAVPRNFYLVAGTSRFPDFLVMSEFLVLPCTVPQSVLVVPGAGCSGGAIIPHLEAWVKIWVRSAGARWVAPAGTLLPLCFFFLFCWKCTSEVQSLCDIILIFFFIPVYTRQIATGNG